MTKPISNTSREETIQIFKKAFNNSIANEFVRKTMIDNYAHAILFHHPQKLELNTKEIKNKCEELVSKIFSEIENVFANDLDLYEAFLKIGRNNPNRLSEWFKEFDEAYSNYKSNSKLPFINNIFKNHMTGSTMIDFGCGGGEITEYLSEQNSIEATGVDILDWRSDKVKNNNKIKFQIADFRYPVSNLHKFDLGIMHAVLHHVSNSPRDIVSYLKNASNVIKNRLLVVEDVVYDEVDQKIEISGIETLQNAKVSQQDFQEFLKFDIEAQKSVINILDLISNSLAMGIPEMNFPFGCQTLSSWLEIFDNSGFKVKNIEVLGFQKNLFHKMSQVLFVLEKS